MLKPLLALIGGLELIIQRTLRIKSLLENGLKARNMKIRNIPI